MKVLIYQPSRSAMQSGRGKTRRWKLVFEERQPKFVEPLNGWVGMRDTTQELNLSFGAREEAIDYAQKHGLEFEIVPTHKRAIKPKSYAENYRWNKVS